MNSYCPASKRRLLSLLAGLAIAACLAPPLAVMAQAGSVTPTETGKPNAPTAAPVLLVFGDSLSAEYGLKRASGWVSLLQDQLKREGFPHRVVNASISGETTAGGVVRLNALLKKHQPAMVILQLGANDGLRGLPVVQTEQNLKRMLQMIRAANARALIVGIRVPPNYGLDYARQFDSVFSRVGQDTQTAVVPFLFEGFAQDPGFFQADEIHPNERAQPRMLSIVWPRLRVVLNGQ
jgi:acyl-CoA thioesterase I